jgi:hypothetical protein
VTSLTRRRAVWFALGAALVTSACQRDSDANFDDSGLMPPGAGGSGASDAGGSDSAAGVDAGGSSLGGGNASAGDPGQGGKASAGTSGGPAVGGSGGSSNGGSSNGGSSSGGKAGTDMGGTASVAGKAGMGGVAGSATAGSGMGGTVVTPPKPITFETTDIDDTYVASCFPSMNYGALASMNVDGEGDGIDSCTYQILIIAPLSGIPAGALVSKATLTLTCTNAGDPITVSYANEPWKELTVRYNTRPEVGATLDTITCQQEGEEVTIELTGAVKAWLAGEHAAHGIYLRTDESDGTDFDTSEAHTTSTRPVFRVTYVPPVK